MLFPQFIIDFSLIHFYEGKKLFIPYPRALKAVEIKLKLRSPTPSCTEIHRAEHKCVEEKTLSSSGMIIGISLKCQNVTNIHISQLFVWYAWNKLTDALVSYCLHTFIIHLYAKCGLWYKFTCIWLIVLSRIWFLNQEITSFSMASG